MRTIFSASVDGALSPRGFRVATGTSVVIAVLSNFVALGVYLAGGIRLPRPELMRWLKEGGTAFQSQPLGGVWPSERSRPPAPPHAR